MDRITREGLHTLAGVLALVGTKIQAVASGHGPHNDLKNAVDAWIAALESEDA